MIQRYTADEFDKEEDGDFVMQADHELAIKKIQEAFALSPKMHCSDCPIGPDSDVCNCWVKKLEDAIEEAK